MRCKHGVVGVCAKCNHEAWMSGNAIRVNDTLQEMGTILIALAMRENAQHLPAHAIDITKLEVLLKSLIRK